MAQDQIDSRVRESKTIPHVRAPQRKTHCHKHPSTWDSDRRERSRTSAGGAAPCRRGGDPGRAARRRRCGRGRSFELTERPVRRGRTGGSRRCRSSGSAGRRRPPPSKLLLRPSRPRRSSRTGTRSSWAAYASHTRAAPSRSSNESSSIASNTTTPGSWSRRSRACTSAVRTAWVSGRTSAFEAPTPIGARKSRSWRTASSSGRLPIRRRRRITFR